MFEMLYKTFRKYRLDNSREISDTRSAGSPMVAMVSIVKIICTDKDERSKNASTMHCTLFVWIQK